MGNVYLVLHKIDTSLTVCVCVCGRFSGAFTRRYGTVFWRKTGAEDEASLHLFDLMIPAVALQAAQVLRWTIRKLGGTDCIKGVDVSSPSITLEWLTDAMIFVQYVQKFVDRLFEEGLGMAIRKELPECIYKQNNPPPLMVSPTLMHASLMP